MKPADLDALLEATPAPCLVLRPDAPRYTIIGVNDAYLMATTCERAHLVGQGLFEVLPDRPDDLGSADAMRLVLASLDRVRQTPLPDTITVRTGDVLPSARGPTDGRWRLVHLPVVDETGSVALLIHRLEALPGSTELARDRTPAAVQARDDDRRGIEAPPGNQGDELRMEGETPFRILFNAMPQLGWTARHDGYVDFFNDRWYEFTGTTFDEMKGEGWRKVHDPAILPRVAACWERSLESGQPFEMELPLRARDGTFRWFLTRVSPIRDRRGNVIRWVGINTDIHDQKQAEAKSEERCRSIITSVHDYAIFMLDRQGKVATWNPGAQRIKGYRAEEIIGRHFSAFYPESDVRAGKCEYELAVASQTGRFEDEGWRLRKDGTAFWANVVISAVRDERHDLLGFAKVTRDLTSRKQAEEDRVRLAKAEEAVRLRDEFLSIASHELKTPLTSLQIQVSGLLRAFRRRPPDPSLRKLAERLTVIDHQLDRLSNLVNDLLDVSRAAAGRLQLDLTELDLTTAAREVVDRLTQECGRAGSRISLDGEPVLVGRWDRLRIDQILTNLLSNAIKYGQGKPIRVSVRQKGDSAILEVTDAGIGIEADKQTRIFERFARGVSSSHYGGLGLGLWIVRTILEALGGTIEVESAPGAGSTFRAILPLAGPPVRAHAQDLQLRHSAESGQAQ